MSEANNKTGRCKEASLEKKRVGKQPVKKIRKNKIKKESMP
jgi:hypothetical protein